MALSWIAELSVLVPSALCKDALACPVLCAVVEQCSVVQIIVDSAPADLPPAH